MPCRDHFVIDKFFLCSEMAVQAFLRAANHVARVVHPQGERLLVRPVAGCMRPEPARCRPVAVLARYAFTDFKRPPALLRRRVQGMTRQTLRRVLCPCAELENTRHALADFTGQRLKRPAVLVFQDPR